jgi:hypothetical protein
MQCSQRLRGHPERRQCGQQKGNSDLRQDSSKWCALFQILHQIIHIVQVSCQLVLLLLCGSRGITLAIGTLSTSTIICTVVERSGELARTTLQHCGDGDGTVCGGYRGRFRHEVEVQELDELKLHFSTCLAGLEEAGNCQQSIKVFEGTGILRGFDKGAHEGYDGCGLDGRAVDWFEEVEEVLK